MSSDRLAAFRAQRGDGGNDTSPLLDDDDSQGGGGYRSRRPNPYAQQDDNDTQAGRYEMSSVNGSGRADDMSAFYAEISDIQESLRTYNANVSQISDLHGQSLNNTDEVAVQRITRQLDALVADTRALANDIKKRIKTLQKKRGPANTFQARKQQIQLVKDKFLEAVQGYQSVEQQYRAKSKQRVERQFKIVKPDATPDEVRRVVEEDQGGQIFAQAIQSSRLGESRAVYREVQDRHQDLKRIERTLEDLATLANDIALLVEEQDEMIDHVENVAMRVETDVEQGRVQTEKAVVSARAARKKRWICFFILVIILIAVAIILAIVLTKKN